MKNPGNTARSAVLPGFFPVQYTLLWRQLIQSFFNVDLRVGYTGLLLLTIYGCYFY